MKIKNKYLLAILLGLLFLWDVSLTTADRFTTPLESSGLSPLWEENFTGGSVDKMQYTWAKGQHAALRSYVMPGAIYLGQEGATASPWVEQELNNFKAYPGEPLPNTLEFDVFSPLSGSNRISLRPRRRGDFAHIHMGFKRDATNVGFSNFASGNTKIIYSEKTGPSFGWAHVTVSYEQYVSGSTTFAHYVVAINEEVREFTAPSKITNPNWLTYWNSTADADGWSIEFQGKISTMGRYLANIRAYNGFVTKPEMEMRLRGRVTGYRSSLPDPRNYHGPTKAFEVHKTLELYGPNALAYGEQIGALTVKFDGSLSSSWNKIASYNWTFGDGASGSGRIVNHTYTQPGTYQANLTVSNKSGTESHQITITVGSTLLTSAYFTSAVPGSQLTFTHTLTNVSNMAASFNLVATPNLPGWTATVSSPNVGALAPGDSASIVVTVQVPPQVAANHIGLITVSATSPSDNAIQAMITDQVIVTSVGSDPTHPIYLPIILLSN